VTTPFEFSMTPESTVEVTLNAWQAQLQQIRSRRLERGGDHAGLAPPQRVHGKTATLAAHKGGVFSLIEVFDAERNRLRVQSAKAQHEQKWPMPPLPPAGP
jgi:hypothetical protein